MLPRFDLAFYSRRRSWRRRRREGKRARDRERGKLKRTPDRLLALPTLHGGTSGTSLPCSLPPRRGGGGQLQRQSRGRGLAAELDPGLLACQGTIAECLAGEEFDLSSEVACRMLATSDYISDYSPLPNPSSPPFAPVKQPPSPPVPTPPRQTPPPSPSSTASPGCPSPLAPPPSAPRPPIRLSSWLLIVAWMYLCVFSYRRANAKIVHSWGP